MSEPSAEFVRLKGALVRLLNGTGVSGPEVGDASDELDEYVAKLEAARDAWRDYAVGAKAELERLRKLVPTEEEREAIESRSRFSRLMQGYLRRLEEAGESASGCCATPPTASADRSPSPPRSA